MRVDVAILAAGRSSRMGGPNKLLAEFGGVPLVRGVADAALASRAKEVHVVLGHQRERVRGAFDGLPVGYVENPHFAEGLSTSLRAAIRHIPEDVSGLLVMLGDMPAVTAAHIDLMIDAFVLSGGEAVIRATHGGRRGNPVILPRLLFPAVGHIEGDVGARHIVEAASGRIVDVEIGEAAGLDLDTQDAVVNAGGRVVGDE